MKHAAWATAAAAVAMWAFAPTSGHAETLRFAHFMPADSWQDVDLFKAWGEAVEEASGGSLSVRVFPAQTLGRAPAGFDNAVNGVADVAWTVQGYTAGRFPLSHIIEMPGLFETAEVGSCAFQKLYDSGALDEEYEDVKVLFVHTHGLGDIHTRDTPVTTLEDLEGLKLRRPTVVIGQLLEELGAEPIGMPAPQIYESVQRGVIDGYMLPWEAVTGFRLNEVTEHHTPFGFYSLAFVTAMNRDAYERLTDEQKAAIDENTGMKWALIAGRGYDEADAAGRAMIEEAGEATIHEIAPEELPAFEAAAERTTEIYLNQLEEMGLPGRETYEAVKGYVEECRAELS